MIAVFAVVVLFGSVAVKFAAALQLMQRYRVEEYLATPDARRLYWAVRIAPILAGSAIVTLGYCAGIWWVELATWLIFALIACLTGWSLWKCHSGRYLESSAERQWR